MSSACEIRPASVAQAEDIVSAMRENLDSRLLEMGMLIYACKGIAAFVAEEIATQDCGGDVHFTVAVVDGRLAACAEMKRFPRHLSLNYIAVRPPFRRRGLGKALLREAITLAGAEGRHEITLDVLADNATARRWYERLGFRTEATAAWWTLPLQPCGHSTLLLREYPQAQACHRAYGFSMFSLVATGCEYKIGRLGDKWFRMSNVEASRMSEVRNILAHLDPSRRVLVSGAAASPPAEQAERAAQWCRMTAELDAIQTRLAGV